MRKYILMLVAGLLAASLHAQERRTCLDSGWQFCYGDGSAALTDFSVTQRWRTLDLRVSVVAEGAGTLLAAGNASPTDMESFRSREPRLFQGRALAILKSGRQAGTIRLTVSAAGVTPRTVSVRVVHGS